MDIMKLIGRIYRHEQTPEILKTYIRLEVKQNFKQELVDSILRGD